MNSAGSGGAAENARMLAALMGVDEDEAAERLQRHALITIPSSPHLSAWAAEIVALIDRTILVTDDPAVADVELVLGPAEPRSSAKRVYADIAADQAKVASVPVACAGPPPHPLFGAISACGVAAAVVHAAVGDARLPVVPDPLAIKYDDIGLPDLEGLAPIDLIGAVLVGAGAVAHGFLRALRHLPVSGELDVLDPKKVGPGNPNRCLYLTEDDLDEFKAEALAKNAASDFPGLALKPEVAEFKDYAGQRGKVPLAIVTIDSRRARRSLQKFIPGRVLDASTTDVRGVVVHSHVQPTHGACLACIYQHVPDEDARERSIAEGLGISLEDVKKGFIDPSTAEKIVARYPCQDPQQLVGRAFDTLFRELCAAQALKTNEGRQVLTPFAFVSALAGALLAVELVRQTVRTATTNYWHLDPWRAPLARVRRFRARAPECEFCSRPEAQLVTEQMWGADVVLAK